MKLMMKIMTMYMKWNQMKYIKKYKNEILIYI